MNHSFIRSIFGLIIGLVLIVWPELAADYLVITLGVLFIFPGLLGLVSYFAAQKDLKPRFPVESIGSLLLGLWLLIMPSFFANVLMILLGVVLLLGGFQQLYMLFRARKWTTVPGFFFITPVLITLAGIFILFNPLSARNTTFIIIGATCVIYAVSELINTLSFQKPKEIEDSIEN